MAPQPYCLFRTGSETRGQDVARSVGADEDSEHAGVRPWAGSPGWSEDRDRHVADDDEPRELIGKEAELSDCGLAAVCDEQLAEFELTTRTRWTVTRPTRCHPEEYGRAIPPKSLRAMATAR